MASNCVECGKEFIPFVTGHNLFCDDCHSIIVKGLNDSSESKKLKQSESRPLKTIDNSELISHEKSYHSVRFHNKFLR